jgi:hypothetical protein
MTAFVGYSHLSPPVKENHEICNIGINFVNKNMNSFENTVELITPPITPLIATTKMINVTATKHCFCIILG